MKTAEASVVGNGVGRTPAPHDAGGLAAVRKGWLQMRLDGYHRVLSSAVGQVDRPASSASRRLTSGGSGCETRRSAALTQMLAPRPKKHRIAAGLRTAAARLSNDDIDPVWRRKAKLVEELIGAA